VHNAGSSPADRDIPQSGGEGKNRVQRSVRQTSTARDRADVKRAGKVKGRVDVFCCRRIAKGVGFIYLRLKGKGGRGSIQVSLAHPTEIRRGQLDVDRARMAVTQRGRKGRSNYPAERTKIGSPAIANHNYSKKHRVEEASGTGSRGQVPD